MIPEPVKGERLRLAGDPPDLPPHAPVFWAVGFRPFFLGAWVLAALTVPWWLAVLSGLLPPPPGLSPAVWHAHEMVFGFGAAVLAGFLLTAARNWTQRETLSGRGLFALFCCWLAGRVAGYVPAPWVYPLELLDLLVLPVVAVAIGRPILAARSRRNYAFPPLLLLLGLLDGLLHLAGSRFDPGDFLVAHARTIEVGAVDVLLVFLAVFGGRVIPLFTGNATGGGVVARPRWDRAAELLCVSLLLADLLPLDPRVAGGVAFAASAACLVRAVGWRSIAALRTPILGVLHVGWAFLIVALAARGLSGFGLLAPTVALHAGTAGALGTLAAGMTTRVALGHTGRELRVDRYVVAAYVLIAASGVLRIASRLHEAGAAWSIGWALIALRLGPALLRRRVDGRPG